MGLQIGIIVTVNHPSLCELAHVFCCINKKHVKVLQNEIKGGFVGQAKDFWSWCVKELNTNP
jgi:hypothetical protein